MANDIYNYGQRRTSIDNPFLKDENWYDFDESPMGGMTRTNAPPTGIRYPGGNPAYSRNEGRYQPSFNPAQGNIPYAPEEQTGIMENLKNKLSGFTTPAMAFMKKMGGVTPEKKAFYDAVTGGQTLGSGQWTRGDYGGKPGYEIYNSPSGLKVGSDIIGTGPGYEKNLYSAFGSQSIEEMEQKKLDWAEKRFNKLGRRGLGTDIYNALVKSGRIGDQRIGDQRPGRTVDTTVTGITRAGDGASTYRGPPTTSFNRAQAVRAGSYDQRAGPMSGSYGPYGRAYGGRIGYQEGELVEDEYMAEATPGGMMEENIEEVQGEPSREQLEAIAFEIFQLPLEELNEQQLEVVYQAHAWPSLIDPRHTGIQSTRRF